jgi:quinol monooxygenase YgiN
MARSSLLCRPRRTGRPKAVYDAPGCHTGKVYRSQEVPSTITHILQWDSVSAQEQFISSPAGKDFLASIGPFLAGPAKLEHFQEV